MTTHTQRVARLLQEAAGIYRTFGRSAEPDSQRNMEDYGSYCERVADLLEVDPEGVVERV